MRQPVSASLYVGILALAGLCPLSASQSIDLNTDQVAFLGYKADHLLAQTEQACKTLHLQFVGPLHFVPTWGTFNLDYEPIISIKGTEIRLDSYGHSFCFRDSDSRFCSYFNSVYGDISENQVFYDKPDEPTWSKEHAIEIATIFEKIFVEPNGALLGPATAQYSHNISEISKDGKTRTRRGIWYVNWPRVDVGGHPFYGDGVVVSFQEGFGPSGVSANIFTPFTEIKKVPISEDKALAKAEWTVYWRYLWEKIGYRFVLADGYQTNVTSYRILSRRLIVVIPQTSSFWNYNNSARLAWEFWFYPIHATPVPAGGWYNEDFSIWIDADTGKFIGGDAML